MQPKTKTLLLVVVSFLLGGIGGGFIGKTYFAERGGRTSPTSREQVKLEFATKLKLDAAQSTQIDTLIEAFRAGFNETRKQYTELFRVRRDSLRNDIRKLLSGEQNQLYDDYIKEMDEREKKYHRGQR